MDVIIIRNLVNRDRFVIEDNPNQISGIPFVTYFVTNYMGDKTETLKHEKILEEQLIKDFELMGDQLELIDEYQQLYSTSNSASGSSSVPPISAPLPGSASNSTTATGQRQIASASADEPELLGAALKIARDNSDNELAESGEIESQSRNTNRSPPAAIAARAISQRAASSAWQSETTIAASRPLALEALRVNFANKDDDDDEDEDDFDELDEGQLKQGQPNQREARRNKTEKKQDTRLLMDVEGKLLCCRL